MALNALSTFGPKSENIANVALTLFALLLFFGLSGMQRRKAMRFSVITGLLLFGWSLPLIFYVAGKSGLSAAIFPAVVLLITYPALAILSFFVGRGSRALFAKIRSH